MWNHICLRKEASLWIKLVEALDLQLSYFKSLKIMLLKCCTQDVSKLGKCSSGHRTGKGQFSFQSQRRAMPKNVQTTGQLHSFHMPSMVMLKMYTQDWPPLEWTGWISLQSKGLSRVFSNTTLQKHQFFSTQLSSQSNSHIHTWPLEKPTRRTFFVKVMSLLFNMLSRLVITFLPKSKCL